MADYAHNYTDKQLEVLEKRFQSVYRQAEKEVTEKLEEYLKKFEAKDKAKQKLLAEGKISEDDYKNWRYGQMMTGKRWKEMRDKLAQDYTNANQNAVDAMNHRLPDVFAENTNYSTYEIENGLHVDTSFTMYDRQTVDRLLRDNPELLPQPKVDIPKDLRWNRQKIQGAIEQGVLQGESIPKIAKRLQKVTDMNKSAATRNARTAMTGAQNGGRIESYKRAKDLGIDMRQCWLATMDSRVRHSHAVMDGETQEVGKEFSNGCMYPGDPNGPPAETWNCRCTLIAQLKGFEHDVSEGRFSKLDDMSYDEWKEYHRQALDKTSNKIKESGESYYKEINIEGMSEQEKKDVNELFRQLDSKWHANISEVMGLLEHEQKEYDLYFENAVKYRMEQNPRKRKSTIEKQVRELMGERPTKADIFKGGTYNMDNGILTMNPNAVRGYKTLEEDAEHRRKMIARWERRGRNEYSYFGNVGSSLPHTFTHEYGHALDYTYHITDDERFKQYYKGFSKEKIQMGLSDYATTDEREFIAEAFAESFFPDTQGEISKGFMKVLEEIVNGKR